MSESREHKTRYYLRLQYIAKFERWLESEPSRIFFRKWHVWKASRPTWRDIQKQR